MGVNFNIHDQIIIVDILILWMLYINIFCKCDTIWGNTAYRGAHSAFLDQPSPYVFIFIDLILEPAC